MMCIRGYLFYSPR
uniref:Uncharacterized protein n=1 Tax=Anguilla anguilla TaxID=7936 RepID=A0A0E9XGY0_ANGAN